MTKQRITQNVLAERRVAGGRSLTLTFRLGDAGATIPAILQLPDSTAPATAVLLLHGWSSRKEQMAETVGRALLGVGLASLAIDLPLHGDRDEADVFRGRIDPLRLMREWTAAVEEGVLAIRYLAARADTDRTRLAVVGYSLGSYVALAVAARDAAVHAVVLAAGGDLPADTPFSFLLRSVADPIHLVRQLAGRPLLMVHGRNDRTIRPDQAERLFAAAGEPKTLQWWSAGHYLPAEAITHAAQWLARELSTVDI